MSDHKALHVLSNVDSNSENWTESEPIPAPEWFEVVREADLATAIHLGRLAIEFGQRDFGSCHWEGHRDVELDVKLVFEQLVDVPTFAEPSGALLI